MLVEKLTIKDTFRIWRDKINALFDYFGRLPITDEDGNYKLDETTTGAKSVIIDIPLYVNSSDSIINGYLIGDVEGNAKTASALKYPVKINGTEFDGSTEIKTEIWGASRNIRISDAKGENFGNLVQVDGSKDYILTLPSTISADLNGSVVLSNPVSINGVKFNGSEDVINYGVCSTNSDVAIKDVTIISTNFILNQGSSVTVKFLNKNTTTEALFLNVNETGEFPILYNGNSIDKNLIKENSVFTFVYDGESYNFVGTEHTDTKVTQTVSTTNAELPILGKSVVANTTTTDTTKFCAGVTLNPSTGTITATTFKGVLSGNASTATKLAASKTIAISGGATGTATAFDGSTNITIPVTALDVSKATAGTLAVARGGTGLTASPSLLINLASTSAANVLAASPRPGVTGVLPVANGGTGSSTKNFVDLSSNQTVAGNKTFSGTITKSISNYGTVNTVLQVTSSNSTSPVIQISEPVEGSTYGKVVCFGSSGNTIIGSGESAQSCMTEVVANISENTYITADGNIYFYTGADTYADKKTASIDASGNFTATKVYNAVWNDYAEFFPRGEETEAGDIISLDVSSKEEKYIKATNKSSLIVGIHSDSFGHLIGGEQAPEGRNFVEYNLPKYIPVGLKGRVDVKFKGKSQLGEAVVPSEIPGVGCLYDSSINTERQIIGYIVEDSSETEELRKLKIFLK